MAYKLCTIFVSNKYMSIVDGTICLTVNEKAEADDAVLKYG